MAETLEAQKFRVLEAFEAAPGQALTTGELHSLPYCVNPRARVSELRRSGCVIDCQPIPHSNSSRYVLVSRPERLNTLPRGSRRESRLLTILPASGIEVWSA
jgi:hypothetical protein